MTRKRWLVTGAMVAWGAVLLVLAVWASGMGPETVREHSDLGEGEQAVDAAVATLQAEAGTGATVEVGPYEVTDDCRITVARRGTAVDQVVTFTVASGQEPQLLDRLAQRVPEQWQARFNPRTERFSADAGEFVRVVGEPTEPGQVQLTVSTGCRPDR